MSDKHYVIKKCSRFTRTQNISILQFLQEIGVKICEGADGSRINLDALSKQQIGKLKRKIGEVDTPIETKFRIE